MLARKENTAVTLDEIIQDIHALEEDLQSYERKYAILSETFYESYLEGDEPADDEWVLDWNDWAGAYEIWLRRRQQYNNIIASLRHTSTLATVIEQAARREPLALSVAL
jgi:hypothetical protein